MKQSTYKILFTVMLSAFVTACSTIDEKRQVDYRSTSKGPVLEVPPDLTRAPEANSPSGATATTYSEYAGGKKDKPASAKNDVANAAPAPAPAATTTEKKPAGPAVLPQIPGVLLERDGPARLLVVHAAPEALWPYLRSFVIDSGLTIEFENPITGIIETGWLDNRATSNGKATAFAKSLSRPTSAGVRDKFRLRIERGKQPGTTNVYLADQGMTDAATAVAGKNVAAKWQVRPADPELEVEMLQLLTAYIGPDGPTKNAPMVAAAPAAVGSAPAPAAAVAAAPQAAAVEAPLRKDGWEYVLDLNESSDAAWQRVGEALERANFRVTERNSAKRRYDVKYTDAAIDEMGRTFLQDTFGMETRKTPPVPYEIYVKTKGDRSVISVRSESGGTLRDDLNKHLLTVVFQNLQ